MAISNRDCATCVFGQQPSSEAPCASCLDSVYRPHFEPIRGKATGITAADLVQCALCEGKFHPVAMRTQTLCTECNHVEMIVRCNILLVRKILRKLNKELIEHD